MTGPREYSKSASIETVLVREGRPVGPGLVWWWLLLAILVGLAIVGLIIYAFYRCGFFRRTDREALDEMQKEPQSASPILERIPSHNSYHAHSPINNMVDHTVDDNDNSTFRDSNLWRKQKKKTFIYPYFDSAPHKAQLLRFSKADAYTYIYRISQVQRWAFGASCTI